MGIKAEVQGQAQAPLQHLEKMQGKNLPIERVFDIQALRVIVDDVPACYAALSRAHELWRPLMKSSTTTLPPQGPTATKACTPWCSMKMAAPLKFRFAPTPCMTMPIAAWRHTGPTKKQVKGLRWWALAAGDFERRVAEARQTVLRQLLAWERDLAAADEARGGSANKGLFDDRIYVFTPDGEIIDLPMAPRPLTLPTPCIPTWATVAGREG